MKRIVVACLLAGMAPVSGRAQPAAAVIRGQVTSAETGDPLPHARVVIFNDAIPLPAIFTDSQGQFVSGPVVAGRYRLTATKAGYAVTSVARIDVSSSNAVEVRMPRAASISGRVVDRFGEPAAGVTVSLNGPPSPNFTSAGVLFKRVTTDDLGEYRFGGLAEGTYFVSTLTQRQDDTGQFQRTNTYFPGVAALADAQGIGIHPGDEKTGVDFSSIDTQPNDFTVGSQIVIQPRVVFAGQAGTPTAPQPVVGTGAIRGIVTRSDGLPIAHAAVSTRVPQTMLGRPTTGLRSVQTDENGQYEFTELPAGQYRINASKLGYTSAAYGQRADDEPPFVNQTPVGTPIDLADGQTTTRIDIVLPRYSAVTGRVVDDYGDPVENVTVTISQIKFQAGRRRLSNVPRVLTSPTDDQGRYRLYGLQPGQYIVNASPGQVVPNQVGSDLSGYAPTYFPGTPNVREAQLVPVPRSEDVTGIDLVLVPTPTAVLSGKRLGSDGQPMGGSLMLMQSQRSGAIVTPAAGARIYDDGRFEFPNVAPGDYVIQSDRGKLDAATEGDFASQFVSVNGNDVPDLLIQSTPGSTIGGRVVFDGDGPPASVRTLSIVPERADLDRTPSSAGSIARGEVHEDLTFEMRGVHGPRRIGVDRPPPGWALKAVIANGIDVTDTPLRFGTPDQSLGDLQVVLTNRLAELLAIGVDSRGQATRDFTLLVFPEDREHWYAASRYFRRASPSPAGYADVRGLPPGDYFVAPVFGMSVLKDGIDAWQDPEFLESIAQRAARATLTEGQTISISARVITP